MKKFLTLVLLATVGAANATLVQWFKLDEGATDPTTNMAYSASSANQGWFTNNGGAVLPVWTNDTPAVPSGSLAAIYLDGTASPRPSINTDYSGSGAAGTVTGTVARTVCAWIKASTNQPSGASHIVSWGGTASGAVTGGRYTFKLQPNGAGADFGKLRLEVQGGGINGTKNLADGKWHHVAVVNTNGSTVGNAKLYVDGAAEPITTSSGTTTPINTVVTTTGIDWVHIGGGNWDLTRGFNGAIDDVRIYDTALTLSDIQTIVFGGTTPAGAQPLSPQTIVLGDTNATATFTVSASGTPPLSYQWFFNGGSLADQTNSSLTIVPAGPANVGLYSVTVSNVFGVTNVAARLTLATAPVDPPMEVALVGANASMSVTMPSASSGYAYQWTRDGTNIAGATASAYTVSSAALPDDSSNYAVVVSLGGNSATSSPPAALHIISVPSSYYAGVVLGDGPAAYWRLGETNGASVAVDQTSFHNGAYIGYTGVELGAAGAPTNDTDTASTFSSTTTNYVEVPYSSELGRTNAYTLEAWVYPLTSGVGQTIMSAAGGVPNAGFELAMDPTGQWVFRTSHSTNSTGLFWDNLIGGPAALNEWTHLVATYDGAVKSLYVNGALAGTQAFNLFAALGINIRLGAGGTAPTPAATVFNGTLDEIAIYRKALSPSQVMAHYLAGVLGAGSAPVPLALSQTGAAMTLSWPGSWVLQQKAVLDNNPGGWTDVTNVSPYTVPTPRTDQQFYRLRSP
jgi:hypothetical protein